MTNMIEHWIDGALSPGRGDRTAPVYNPASGEVVAHVRLGSADDVDASVDAASRASVEWAQTSLSRRTRILFAFRELVSRCHDELARAITAEHGKTIDDARGEVQRGLEVVEFACGIAHLLKGEFSVEVSTAVDAYSMRQPIGVVAGITPFNFPIMVPMWMHPIAIACGNAFVLKPSEKDPTPSLLTAELWQEAGLPAGVFNVVNGDREAVDRLLEHPDVIAVSFVGSTPVARHIYETAAAKGKRVQALGGAKNHMVVMPDADLEGAADAAVSAGYGSAGERCMSISVVVVVGDVADDLVKAISTRAGDLYVGPGADDGVEMGPLVTPEHRDRVAGYIDLGVTEGADLVVDGRDLVIDGHPDGFWLGPTLFDGVTPEMTIYQDEIFGPVLCVVRVESLADAVQLVNRNAYGNGTAIFTENGGVARTFSSAIHVGMVGVNVAIPVPMAYYTFGGWDNSRFGDLNAHGVDGVRFYTRPKTVTARWPRNVEGIDLVMPTAG